MIRVIDIEDSGKCLVRFDRPGDYEVTFNGNITNVAGGGLTPKEVELDGVDEIRLLTLNSYISHYENPEGNKLSVEGFEAKKDILSENSTPNDNCSYGRYFEDLDEEYAFKKFMKTWTPIRKTVITKSDPLPLQKYVSKFETGNPFITSGLSFADGDPSVFYFDKSKPASTIVRETFEELGMKFVPDTSYSATNGKKIWGNSNHSGIRYVTAFGTYVFSDNYDFTRSSSVRGELKSLQKQYEDLKTDIRSKIISRYNLHFRNVSESDAIEMTSSMLSALKAVYSGFAELDYKVKDSSKYHSLAKKMREAISETESNLSKIGS